MIDLYNGDCLEVMDKFIEDGIVFDAIITDPPYGTTACKWDSIIPFDEMWLRLNKLIKPNGVIVLFGSEPFSSQLRVSNLEMYRYDWKWEKSKPTGFMLAKKQPLRNSEDIIIFYTKQPTYKPIKWYPSDRFLDKRKTYNKARPESGQFVGNNKERKKDDGSRLPTTIIGFESFWGKDMHPTQKPVSLMEYLIKTYTNEGELVLDFTMGSGTTLVASKQLNRKGIGIELDKDYFKIAQKRVNEAIQGSSLEMEYKIETDNLDEF